MATTTQERLSEFLDYLGMGAAQFERAVGLSNGLIGKVINHKSGFSNTVIEKILSKFPQLDVFWLFTGEGEMVKKVHLNVHPNVHPIASEPQETYGKMPVVVTLDALGNDNIAMVSTRAAASYPVRMLEPEFYRELPAFQLPGGEYRNGLFRAFEVQGDSMSDTLYAGDIVISRYLDRNFMDVRDGYIHIVVTNDEVLVKRVLNRAKQGKLILKSDNESYGNIVMPTEQVKEMWLVKSKISLYLPNRNAEIGKVVNDLQARLALLEEEFYGNSGKKRLKGS